MTIEKINTAINSESPDIFVRKVTQHPTTGGVVVLPKKWKGEKALMLFYSSTGIVILVPLTNTDEVR